MSEWTFTWFLYGGSALPAALLGLFLTVARYRRRSLEWRRSGPPGPGLICFVALVLPLICHFARLPLLQSLVEPSLDILAGVTVDKSLKPGAFATASLWLIRNGLIVIPLFLWLWWIGPVRFQLRVLLAAVTVWMLAKCVMVVPAALELAFSGQHWTIGSMTPLTPFRHVLDFTLPASATVITSILLVRGGLSRLRRRAASVVG